MSERTEPKSAAIATRTVLVVGWSIFFVLLIVVVSRSKRSANIVHKASQPKRIQNVDAPLPTALSSQRKAASSNQSLDRELEQSASIDFIPVFESSELMADIATVSFQVEQPLARVLIVRGIFTVFSLGMNDLGKRLQRAGYDVRVTTAIQSSAEVEKMSWLYGNHSDVPLVIIGHSLGGDLAPRLASNFAQHNVPVDLLIMLDSTLPSSPPPNVRRCINMFQSSNKSPFQGRQIATKFPNTELYNVDIRKLFSPEQTAGIHHFNIDTSPWVHDLIVDAVHQGTHIQSAEVLAANLNLQYTEQAMLPQTMYPAAPQASGVRMTFGDAPNHNTFHQKR